MEPISVGTTISCNGPSHANDEDEDESKENQKKSEMPTHCDGVGNQHAPTNQNIKSIPRPIQSLSYNSGSRPDKLPDGWKTQMLNAAIDDIKRAEFVAIDLEFSGLFKTPMRHHILEKYFQTCASCVGEFMTVQLGICPVWRSIDDDDYQTRAGCTGNADVWCMAPYNFHVFPSYRRIFSSDTSTISWLFDNGFSFHDWILNGFDYARLALLQQHLSHISNRYSTSLDQIRQDGLQRLISAIIDNEKPVVLHNGLLDMLHIHDKFIDTIPSTVTEFCYEWLRLFTGGVFDTKYIAISGKYSVLNIMEERGTMLDSLHRHLYKTNLCRSHMCLAPRYFTSSTDTNTSVDSSTNTLFMSTEQLTLTGNYSLPPGPIGHEGSKCHEAGYDALITAQVFLMENELYHKANKKSQDVVQSCEVNVPIIPLNWASSTCFGSHFKNMIELVKIAPGKIDLCTISKAHNPSINILSLSAPNSESIQLSSSTVYVEPPLSSLNLTEQEQDISIMEGPRKKRRTKSVLSSKALISDDAVVPQSSSLSSSSDNESDPDNVLQNDTLLNSDLSDKDDVSNDIHELMQLRQSLGISKFKKKRKSQSNSQCLISHPNHYKPPIKNSLTYTQDSSSILPDVSCTVPLAAMNQFSVCTGLNDTLIDPSSNLTVLIDTEYETEQVIPQKQNNWPQEIEHLKPLHPYSYNNTNVKSSTQYSPYLGKNIESNVSVSQNKIQTSSLQHAPSSTWATPLKNYISSVPQSTDSQNKDMPTRPPYHNKPSSHRYFPKIPYNNSFVSTSNTFERPRHFFPNQTLDLTKNQTNIPSKSTQRTLHICKKTTAIPPHDNKTL